MNLRALFGYVPGSKTDLVVQKVEVGGNCDGLVAALNGTLRICS